MLLFARNFFRHPMMLGSIIPSSRFLVREVLDRIDWKNAGVIVEYGPGIGNFTAEILERMRPDATLFIFETNPDFVRYLRASFNDPRLHIAATSAADVDSVLKAQGFTRADYVISGVPFSTMPAEVRESILQTTRAILNPAGAFLVYQFSTRVLADLTRIFPKVDRAWEPLNILPAHVFACAGD
ncbi:MAG: hypothetical protein QOI24_4339 [Acidobacteriota bacterium]|jgi:phospholipid N-methyltransferase|nr:hypothetical protein [Acidobacteriota bacterium]